MGYVCALGICNLSKKKKKISACFSIPVSLTDNDSVAKGPGLGVRKPRFKHQLWHSLACDYGQVTPEDPVSLSRKMQKENEEEKKKENGEEVMGCPLHTPSPFPP